MQFTKHLLKDSNGEILGIYCTSLDITEAVEAHANLSLLADSIPGGYITYELDDEGLHLVYFSDGFCALFGCTREEYDKVAKKGPLDRVFEEDRPALLNAVSKLYTNDIPVKMNYRIHVKGGGYRWVSPQCSHLRKEGKRTLIHVALFDVTEKQEAAHLTAKMEQKLSALLANVNGGISAVSFNESGSINVLFANDQYYEMLGLKREIIEAGDYNLWHIVHPDDRKKTEEKVYKLLADHIQTYYEFRCIKTNGETIHIRCDASVMDEGVFGQEVLISNIVDVTSEKVMLDNLRISHEEARLAVEHGKALVGKYEVATKTLTLPKTMSYIFGSVLTIKNVPYEKKNLNKVLPESRATYIEFYEKILRGEKEGSAVFQKKSLIGDRWIDAKFSTVFSSGGKPVSAVISLFDITEQMEKEAVYKKWQQSLRNRKQSNYMLFRSNISKNTVFDSVEGTLLPITYPKTLITFDQQVAHYTSLLVHPDDKQWYLAYLRSDAMLARYYRGKLTDVFDYRELTADGGYRWIRCTAELVEYPNSTDIQSYLGGSY